MSDYSLSDVSRILEKSGLSRKQIKDKWNDVRMIIPTLIIKCPEKMCELMFPADDIGQKYEECPNCLTRIRD